MQLESVYEQVIAKLSKWGDTFAEMLPNIIVALLVIGLFWLMARASSSASDRALRRFDTHEAARDLVSRILRIAVILVGVVVALGVMNLDKALASILAGAGIVGLPSVLRFESWRGTSFTAAGRRRVDIECGVSHSDDLEKVERVVAETLEGVEGRDHSHQVQVFFTGFGSSAVNLVGRFWIEYEHQTDYGQARSKAIVAIRQAFDANGIVIPFPIRTLDFGTRGGKPLAQALPSTLPAFGIGEVNGAGAGVGDS